jgi:hypothetical protein
MRKKYLIGIGLVMLIGSGVTYFLSTEKKLNWPQKRMVILNDEEEELETENSYLRARHEWLISRDLRTGTIPDGIHARELEWLKSQPVNSSGIFQSCRQQL